MQTEVLEVAIAKAAPIEQLEFAIDTLGKASAVSTVEVVQDALPPVVECFDKGWQGTQARCLGLGLSVAQPAGGGLAIHRLSKPGAEGSFQLVAGLEFRRYGEHLRQLCGFCGSQVCAILDQQPASAFHDGLGRLSHLSSNGPPGFRDRVGQALHDGKALHNALRVRKPSFRGGGIGVPQSAQHVSTWRTKLARAVEARFPGFPCGGRAIDPAPGPIQGPR